MNEESAASADREPAGLAWPWLWAALIIQLMITVGAWIQDPQPIPITPREPKPSFWTPIEINPRLRLLPVADSLNSVTFMLDGQRGWAVGTSGAIIATTDGGQTWRRQASNTTDFLHTVFFLPDGKRGWAIGINGAIVATRNGGRNWSYQHSNITTTLEIVTFLADGLHGWTAGDDGKILATEDGGAHWYAQQTNTKRSIRSLWFDSAGQQGFATIDSGNQLVTDNGGQRWVEIQIELSPILGTMTFLSDGKLGWSVWGLATDGLGDRTTDGGKTWLEMTMPARSTYRALAFHTNGLNGWAVGDSGAISATGDGGISWRNMPIKTPTDFLGVATGDDVRHGWIVSQDGAVLATSDGGASWHHQTRDRNMVVPPGRYMRFPAPWYPVATLLCAGMVWMSWRQRHVVTPKESIADVAASDAEVSAADEDRLKFAGLARGISRFLRNNATSPPLTLAVTGDWGSGKSSLMRLICADLRLYGHRPIWFNAWHYQKEEHLFAALLGAVKVQGVPSLLTWQGLPFRVRLLWLRSRRHVGIALALVALFSAQAWLALTGFLDGGLAGGLQSFREASLWSASLAAAATLTALFAIAKGTKLFGLDPAVLLTGIRDKLNLKTAVAQNDFRAQFACDFQQLIDALPHRLFIVIDDLDRCRPEAVLEVMETVNYLTSAGKCFVMFGMATDRVQAAIGLAFKDIAAELVQMDRDRAPAGVAGNESADAALIKRRSYARDYLQKLVNIEIKVPTDQFDLAHTLLVTPAGRVHQQHRQRLIDVARHWPIALTMVAVCTGVWLADRMRSDLDVPRPAVSPPSDPAVVSPVAPQPDLKANTSLRTPPEPEQRLAPVVIQEAQQSHFVLLLVLLGIAFIPVAAAMAVVLVRLFKPDLPETRDSPRFRHALHIWVSVVAAKHGTPRSIKRFGNRIRYLAMLQQGDIATTSLMQRCASLFTRRRRARVVPTADSSSRMLDEAQLIAMAAIHEVTAERWLQVMLNEQWSEQERRPESGLASIVNNAIGRHQQKFDTVWPPTAEEITVFEQLIGGVRLSGDPHIIVPVVRASRGGVDSHSVSPSSP